MEGKLPSFPILKRIFQFDNFLSKIQLICSVGVVRKEDAESLNRFLRPFEIIWGISFVSPSSKPHRHCFTCVYLCLLLDPRCVYIHLEASNG